MTHWLFSPVLAMKNLFYSASDSKNSYTHSRIEKFCKKFDLNYYLFQLLANCRWNKKRRQRCFRSLTTSDKRSYIDVDPFFPKNHVACMLSPVKDREHSRDIVYIYIFFQPEILKLKNKFQWKVFWKGSILRLTKMFLTF